mmetsp:Transcript_27329/g.56676  ORF Transcript_27329/g.56676 Transcript_27329/m.56676 type:complete len:219 (-) Transcript_27329:300-956(-)
MAVMALVLPPMLAPPSLPKVQHLLVLAALFHPPPVLEHVPHDEIIRLSRHRRGDPPPQHLDHFHGRFAGQLFGRIGRRRRTQFFDCIVHLEMSIFVVILLGGTGDADSGVGVEDPSIGAVIISAGENAGEDEGQAGEAEGGGGFEGEAGGVAVGIVVAIREGIGKKGKARGENGRGRVIFGRRRVTSGFRRDAMISILFRLNIESFFLLCLWFFYLLC